jgi:hypothetical protein
VTEELGATRIIRVAQDHGPDLHAVQVLVGDTALRCPHWGTVALTETKEAAQRELDRREAA